MENDRWYALEAQYGHEKICSAILISKRYEVFLPTCLKRSHRGHKLLEIEMPLFPRYLFCKFTSQASGMIVTTPGLVRILGIGRSPIPVPDQELESVKQISQSGRPARLWRYLSSGSRVRIDSGPLLGLSGLLVTDAAKTRLVVSLSLLQRSVAVELDDNTALTPLFHMPPSHARVLLPGLSDVPLQP